MRILHLGPDVASQMSVTVRALRRAGADAVGLRLPGNGMSDADGEGIETLEPLRRDRPLQRLARARRRAARIREEIARADVVHWHFGAPVLPRGADLTLAARDGIPGVVEFWGSDIRIDGIAEVSNPPYAGRGPDYEYASMETRRQSYRRQSGFIDASVRACLLPPGFERYLRPGAFPERWSSLVRVDRPPERAPHPKSEVPLVVHAPSAPIAKGTAWVLAAVEQVRTDGIAFEFRAIEGMAHEDALSAIRAADIVLDQFILGDAYGAVAVEAMAAGAAAVGWLTDDACAVLPADLPLVVSDGPSLPGVLRGLLTDPDRCRRLGGQGPLYVAAHHDADAFAQRLLTEIYPEVIRSGR